MQVITSMVHTMQNCLHTRVRQHSTVFTVFLLFLDEMNLVLLLSPKTRAKIISVNTTDALKMPGVEAIFDAGDIGDANFIKGKGLLPVFACNEVSVTTMCERHCTTVQQIKCFFL